jgi:hypothetical protein
MAKDIIEIEFKPKGDKDLINAIKKLDKATKSLVKSQSKLVAEGRKVKETNEKLNKGKEKLAKGTRILGGTFAVLRSKILLFNFAMALGIRQLINFNKHSAKVESMERAFTTLTGGANNAGVAITKLKKATNDTMSEFDLFQQANNAMVLGVSRNSDEMSEMFDIAQRLGRALGRDTASSVESLITGIGRQSRLMLDNIGIIVKADEAYDSYARKLGTTSDKLTDAQKKQAFLEATMESARSKVASLGDETLTSQDALDKLTASTSNLASAIGDNLGFFTKLGSIIADYSNNLADNIKDVDRYTEIQKKLNFELQLQLGLANDQSKSADVTRKLSNLRIESLMKEQDALDQIDESNKKRSESEKKLAEAIRIKGLSEDVSKAFSEGRFNIDKQQFEFNIRYKDSIQNVTDALDMNIEKVKEQKISFDEVDSSLNFLDQNQKFAVESLNSLSRAMAQATINGQNMGDAVVSSLKAIAVELIAKAGTYALLNVFTGGAFGATTGLFSFLTAHTGGLIKDANNIQRFANGGIVQGQDNIPIMAQAGEFVMKKSAVEQIGAETLHQMNQGNTNAGGVNITINGNMIGNEEFVRDTLIPEINKTVRQGLA